VSGPGRNLKLELELYYVARRAHGPGRRCARPRAGPGSRRLGVGLVTRARAPSLPGPGPWTPAIGQRISWLSDSESRLGLPVTQGRAPSRPGGHIVKLLLRCSGARDFQASLSPSTGWTLSMQVYSPAGSSRCLARCHGPSRVGRAALSRCRLLILISSARRVITVNLVS
jgi:hypothetical protein